MATKRVNVVNWTDCRVLTKLCNEIHEELTEYAHRGYENNQVYGDSNVIVALINMQKRIESIRERSEKAIAAQRVIDSLPAGSAGSR